MKRQILRLLLILGVGANALAQESEYVLKRSRIVGLSPDSAWANCIEIVKAAPAIVNTIDSASRLVAFSLPLGVEDVKNLVLDSKDINKKQALTLHVTVWISERGKETRVYVRAAPNGGGFFSHSNGQIEQQILDAIEKGGKWMAASQIPKPHVIKDAMPAVATREAVEAILASHKLKLNTSSAKPALLTISLTIPSADLASFVPGLVKNYYPGVAHVTLWFEPSGPGTAVPTRTLVLESGSLSPVPLASNEKLETAVLAAIEARIGGTPDAIVSIGSEYRGKPEFWNVLFGLDAPPNSSEAEPKVARELPVPIERAWAAALQVITQSQVIARVERGAGAIEFLAAHSSQAGAKYFVHRVVIELTSTASGTRMSLSIPHARETIADGDSELKVVADRIGTELFIKDRLTWLTMKKGSK